MANGARPRGSQHTTARSGSRRPCLECVTVPTRDRSHRRFLVRISKLRCHPFPHRNRKLGGFRPLRFPVTLRTVTDPRVGNDDGRPGVVSSSAGSRVPWQDMLASDRPVALPPLPRVDLEATPRAGAKLSSATWRQLIDDYAINPNQTSGPGSGADRQRSTTVLDPHDMESRETPQTTSPSRSPAEARPGAVASSGSFAIVDPTDESDDTRQTAMFTGWQPGDADGSSIKNSAAESSGEPTSSLVASSSVATPSQVEFAAEPSTPNDDAMAPVLVAAAGSLDDEAAWRAAIATARASAASDKEQASATPKPSTYGDSEMIRIANERAQEEHAWEQKVAELKAQEEAEWERKIAEVRRWDESEPTAAAKAESDGAGPKVDAVAEASGGEPESGEPAARPPADVDASAASEPALDAATEETGKSRDVGIPAAVADRTPLADTVPEPIATAPIVTDSSPTRPDPVPAPFAATPTVSSSDEASASIEPRAVTAADEQVDDDELTAEEEAEWERRLTAARSGIYPQATDDDDGSFEPAPDPVASPFSAPFEPVSSPIEPAAFPLSGASSTTPVVESSDGLPAAASPLNAVVSPLNQPMGPTGPTGPTAAGSTEFSAPSNGMGATTGQSATGQACVVLPDGTRIEGLSPQEALELVRQLNA